jgi:NAD(P)-dependent dehydrogenase (short-subunit alcohol dehydrogenase family)
VSPSAVRVSARSGSASAAISALRTAAIVKAARLAAAMNGKQGEGALSATMATRSTSSGRPRPRSAKLTQSIDAISARPLSTAATLASCEPVRTTEEKNAAPPAIGAIIARNVVANMAGYGHLGPIEDTSIEGVRAQIDTNLFGPIHLSKAAIPIMRAQGSGHILNFSSVGDGSGRQTGPPIRPRSLGSRAFGSDGDRVGVAGRQGDIVVLFRHAGWI